MKEIEFRGKRINYFQPKEPPKWIYGPANCTESLALMLVKEYNIWTDVERETVGQWTGLKDKNGVKIYEGDVVKVGRRDWIVVWSSRWLAFEIAFDDFEISFGGFSENEIEVIGNIFDNPELDKQFGEVYRSKE